MNTSTREDQFAIKDWLASHGFSAHIAAFEANSIGREELLLLTEEDLRELGVRSLGERKRMTQQIAALKRPSFTSFIGKIGRLALSATQGIFIYSFIIFVLAQYAFASDAINYSTYANTYEHIRSTAVSVSAMMIVGLFVSFLTAPLLALTTTLRHPEDAKMFAAALGGLLALGITWIADKGTPLITTCFIVLYSVSQGFLYLSQRPTTRQLVTRACVISSVLPIICFLTYGAVRGGLDRGIYHPIYALFAFLIGVAGFFVALHQARRIALL